MGPPGYHHNIVVATHAHCTSAHDVHLMCMMYDCK